MVQASKPLWKISADAAFDAERQGLVDIAEKQYQWSLSLAQETFGTVHESSGEALINLADFYMTYGRLDESREFYRRALEVYDRLFGRDSLVAAMIYGMLAELSCRQARERDAKVFHARALNILERRQAS